MPTRTLKSLFLLSLVIFNFTGAHACSLAFWNTNSQAKVVARSMDLYISDQPSWVVYPRGMKRDGGAGANSLKWQSNYGSVVITAFNSNAASDGMNEKGLAAHLLYLQDTHYAPRNAKIPALSNLMWAQYLLDTAATVNDALIEMKNFQVVATELQGKTWPIHLAIQDATGDSAIIEFIDGKMVVHHGKQFTVLTNEPAYNIQLANLKKYRLFGGNLAMPGDIDPLSRFVRASSYLKTLPAPKNYIETIAGAFAVIRTTMVPLGAVNTLSGKASEDTWVTRWISVMDLTNKIYYFNSTTALNIIWLDFNKLDLSAGAAVKKLDLNKTNLIGEVSNDLVAVTN